MAKKKKKSAKPTADVPIEEAMDELDSIVEAMESGQTSLADSLERFERGMVLLRSCHQQLDSAAQRIEILSAISDDGDISTRPFDGTATSSQMDEKEDDTDDSGMLF